MQSHIHTHALTYPLVHQPLQLHTISIRYIISQCHRYIPHHTDITVCTTTHRHTTLHSVTHIHNTVQQQSTHIQHVSIKHTTQDISNLYYQRGGRIPTALTVVET